MITIVVDGTNKGLYGIVVTNEEGEVIAKKAKRTRKEITNNQAEYKAIALALMWVERENHQEVEILSDSQLAVKQISGEYQVKSEKLIDLKKEVDLRVVRIKNQGKKIQIKWVPRERVSSVDSLLRNYYDNEG